VGAWLERDIGGGTAGQFAGVGQRLRLGMRAATDRGGAAADDLAIADDDATNGRIGGGLAEMEETQADRLLHELRVVGRSAHRSIVQWIASDLGVDLGDHLLEVLGVREVAIDRSISDKADVIEALQRFQHLQADLLGADLDLA
jgi:hypothetical protein